MAKERRRHFIAGAIVHPGRLTRAAEKAGAVTQRGTIRLSFIRSTMKAGGSLGRAAGLAWVLRGLRKRRHEPPAAH